MGRFYKTDDGCFCGEGKGRVMDCYFCGKIIKDGEEYVTFVSHPTKTDNKVYIHKNGCKSFVCDHIYGLGETNEGYFMEDDDPLIKFNYCPRCGVKL